MKLTALLASLLLATAAHAGTPAFTLAAVKVVLTPDATHAFTADSAVTRDGTLVYELQGQTFADDSGAIAPHTGTTPRSTPWETFAELLTAYSCSDVSAIRGLYTADSEAFFERLEAKPAMRERWLAAMAKMTAAKVVFAYQDGNRVFAFIEAPDAAFVCPYAFEKCGDKYLLTTQVGDGNTTFSNLSLAFAAFQMKPADIVRP